MRPGTQLGDVVLEELVARGGMGEVYRGRMPDSSRCAVKLIRANASSDGRFRALFEREMEIAARLEHPRIVRMVDRGWKGDQPYLVVEWVDGLTLGQLVRRARESDTTVPLNCLLVALSDLAEALFYAHSLEPPVLHRDVSPDNALVSKDGDTFLIDFGIAKSWDTASITRTNELRGKLGFMAPEYLAGDEIDNRADLFALGVTAYWLLGRKLPFAVTNLHDVHEKICAREYKPLRELNPEVSPELSALVDGLLSPEREKRPDDASGFADALKAAVADQELARMEIGAFATVEHTQQLNQPRDASEPAVDQTAPNLQKPDFDDDTHELTTRPNAPAPGRIKTIPEKSPIVIRADMDLPATAPSIVISPSLSDELSVRETKPTASSPRLPLIIGAVSTVVGLLSLLVSLIVWFQISQAPTASPAAAPLLPGPEAPLAVEDETVDEAREDAAMTLLTIAAKSESAGELTSARRLYVQLLKEYGDTEAAHGVDELLEGLEPKKTAAPAAKRKPKPRVARLPQSELRKIESAVQRASLTGDDALVARAGTRIPRSQRNQTVVFSLLRASANLGRCATAKAYLREFLNKAPSSMHRRARAAARECK